MIELIPHLKEQTHKRDNLPEVRILQVDLGAKPTTLEEIRKQLSLRADQTFTTSELFGWMNARTRIEENRLEKRLERLRKHGYIIRLDRSKYPYKKIGGKGFLCALSKRSLEIIAQYGSFLKIESPTMYYARKYLDAPLVGNMSPSNTGLPY